MVLVLGFGLWLQMVQERICIAQSQWRRCFVVMTIYIYIDVLKRFKVQNPQNRGQWLKKTCIFSYYFLIKKLHFEKLLKGTPVGRLSLPNNVHVHPQLKNTLSPAGHKLISIELLAYPLDLKGNSIESKMISIEILTYPLESLDLTGKSMGSNIPPAKPVTSFKYSAVTLYSLRSAKLNQRTQKFYLYDMHWYAL